MTPIETLGQKQGSACAFPQCTWNLIANTVGKSRITRYPRKAIGEIDWPELQIKSLNHRPAAGWQGASYWFEDDGQWCDHSMTSAD